MKHINVGLLICLICILLVPLVFTLWGSLLDIHGSANIPPRLGSQYSFDNYKKVFANINIRWIFNTIVLTILGVSLSITINLITGYGLYLDDNKRLITLILAAVIIPRYAIVIPQFLIMRQLGLVNTLFACILPLLVSPMHILLAKKYFDQFPISIIEAARLDGLTRLGALIRIILPESRQLVITLAILKSVELWSDYLWQYIVLMKDNKKTLLIGVLSWIQQAGGASSIQLNPVGLTLTTSVLLLIPFIIIFAVGSRYFTYQLGGSE